jgi:serine/threonine-protein kinase HipA
MPGLNQSRQRQCGQDNRQYHQIYLYAQQQIAARQSVSDDTPEQHQKPCRNTGGRESVKVDIAALVALASEILQSRSNLSVSFEDSQRKKALGQILRVGTSAGGARAKAVIAWHPGTGEVRSGQVGVDEGFEHWILKFDGVNGTAGGELTDPLGFGAVEYAYYRMATAAGVAMSRCRLFEENGRRHFMTRRFDRPGGNMKLHMQSLCGLAHFDFNIAGTFGYEQAFQVMRLMKLPMEDIEQLFRRMLFNIMARNQDDHTKNIAFLMDRSGRWRLAPAFDITYSYNPDGEWTAKHQMSVNSKRDGFRVEDFSACAQVAGLKRNREKAIRAEVRNAILRWPDFADDTHIPVTWRDTIQQHLRLSF